MIESDLINRAISADEHWKAKELLQGRLRSSSRFDCDLYESYGYLLLNMHDTLEAGKYLFLSGARESNYQPAIDMYLSKYSKKDIQHLFHTFPKSAQSASFSDYPPVVAKELESRGFSSKATKRTLNKLGPEESSSAKFGALLFGIILFSLVIGFLISSVRGITWLVRWLIG